MNPIFFTSCINKKYQKDLEKILFFNENQKNYTEQINKSISRFGVPQLIFKENSLNINIKGFKDCQNIFVFDGDSDDASLLGLMIFYRESIEKIIILHIAITEECSSSGKYSNELITLRLINNLRKDLGKIKDIKSIYFSYKTDSDELSDIPIKHL